MSLYGARFTALVRAARDRRALGPPTARTRVTNPLCGDEIELALRLEGSVISEATYRYRGCALVAASAELLAEVLRGATMDEALELAERLDRALGDPRQPFPSALDPLADARLLPARRRCATLPWEALRKSLDPRR